MERIYLDFNASTPVAENVAAVLTESTRRCFGNASSGHWAGGESAGAVAKARGQAAELLGAKSDEIVFTSGGTEAVNHALKGAFFAGPRPWHVVTTALEHPATLATLRFLETLGAEVSVVGARADGILDLPAMAAAVRPETRLFAVMHANNETGVIQPVRAVADLARRAGALTFVDAAQSVGKIPVDVDALGADLLAVAGHKFYAPKGIGALYVRRGVTLASYAHGAGHESGRRAGTSPAPSIAALGAACIEATNWLPRRSVQLELRDYFWKKLCAAFGDGLVLHGASCERLPNTLFVSFRGRVGADVLAAVPEIAASTGSACHTGATKQSPVLAAMGVPEPLGLGAVRFSLGRETTRAEIDRAVELLTERVA